MRTVTIYTDGACSGNPGPGGWGAILEWNGVEKELSGGEEPQHRGGSGMKNYNITDKTGPVAAVKVVQESDDVLVVSDDGVIIRMEAAGISELGRATQGVRIMRLSEGARVISVALTDRAESEDAAPAEEPEA